MSSVVTAPGERSSRPSGTTSLSPARGGGPSRDLTLGLLAAGVLTAIAFIAGGGNGLASNTWVQIALVVVAAVTGIGAVIAGSSGRRWGIGAVLAFAALGALTYASIGWSVQPANSWLEANRTLSYLAAFTAALLLARLAPGRWRALIGAVAVAATVACGYALLVKVFPATLDPHDPFGRLRAPFDYWNAVGLMAAMGLPACVWCGARREGAPVIRALAVPAIAILIAAVVLSLSRGAVLAAVVAGAVWFAIAPLRLRSTLVLALGSAAGAVISVWGLAHRGISADGASTAVRVAAGHSFGVVIAVALIVSAIAGMIGIAALDKVRLSARWQRRVGGTLIGLVALVPVGGVAALASSHRGFSGEVSHLWHSLTSTSGGAGNQPGRLAQLSNSRPRYWSLAFKIGSHHPLAGVGALGFATAQERYATGPSWALQLENVTHAHGYVVETFADFGAIGLAISLALLVAWIIATARTFELSWPRRGSHLTRGPPESQVPAEPAGPHTRAELVAERAGLAALLAVVVTFGAHSLIDWTWFIPGNAVVALVCAGWLAGRGPLGQRIGRLPHRRAILSSPLAIATIVSVAVATVVAAWVIAQSLRSADAYSSAITAALRGDGATALTDARAAAAQDPVSVDPLFLLARLDVATGNRPAARQELSEAVSRQPANPGTWQQLGCYDLRQHAPALAWRELHQALALEPAQTEVLSDPPAFCASLAS